MLTTNKKHNELKVQVGSLSASLQAVQLQNTELETRLGVLEAELSEYIAYKKKKEGETPYIEVLSESFDERDGLEVKLDWNEAMINYLKRNGYRGVDDDSIIQKYVSDLFNEKISNEAQNSIV